MPARYLFALILSLLLAVPAMAVQNPAPMVDGDCSEYAQLPARRIELASDMQLYIYEDEHYLWMCYTYPPGSLGMLDMKLKTGKLPVALNLHASAQLGEWPVDRDDLVPQVPESDLWWNISGWTANTVAINGLDTSGPKPRFRFKNAKARELQLSKQRFGHGDWQFSMGIYNIKAKDGTSHDVRFPADGSYYTLHTR